MDTTQHKKICESAEIILHTLGEVKAYFSNECMYDECKQIDKYNTAIIDMINTIHSLKFEED